MIERLLRRGLGVRRRRRRSRPAHTVGHHGSSREGDGRRPFDLLQDRTSDMLWPADGSRTLSSEGPGRRVWPRVRTRKTTACCCTRLGLLCCRCCNVL